MTIEAAIRAPGDTSWSTTSSAPTPRMATCRSCRTARVTASRRVARRLAASWASRPLPWPAIQRLVRARASPMPITTSALRIAVSTRRAPWIDSRLAASSGARVARSPTAPSSVSSTTPIAATSPIHGCSRNTIAT